MKANYRRRTALFDVATGSQIWSALDGGGPAAFSPDGSIVASLGRNGLNLWRASDGSLVRSMPALLGGIAFSQDGRFIATAGPQGGEFPQDYPVKIFRVADG